MVLIILIIIAVLMFIGIVQRFFMARRFRQRWQQRRWRGGPQQ